VNVRTNGYWVLVGIWWCACFLAFRSRKLTSGHLVIYQQPRPGPNLPKGQSYLTIGWKQVIYLAFLLTRTSFLSQIGVALKQYKKIPHTFIYLFAYFLLADVCVILTIYVYVNVKLTYSVDLDQGLNTTGLLVVICQNDKFKFSFLQNTYLGLAQAVTSTASTLGFYYIQRYWKISTKKMVWSLPLFFSWERININGFSSS
jgi:hypothetical protein